MLCLVHIPGYIVSAAEGKGGEEPIWGPSRQTNREAYTTPVQHPFWRSSRRFFNSTSSHRTCSRCRRLTCTPAAIQIQPRNHQNPVYIYSIYLPPCAAYSSLRVATIAQGKSAVAIDPSSSGHARHCKSTLWASQPLIMMYSSLTCIYTPSQCTLYCTGGLYFLGANNH